MPPPASNDMQDTPHKHPRRRSCLGCASVLFILVLVAGAALWAMNRDPSASGKPIAGRDACAVPKANSGFTVASPQQSGFDSNMLCDVVAKANASTMNLHSLLVLRKGILVTEVYRSGKDRSIYSIKSHRQDFNGAQLHDMRSVSKSVIGLVYGQLLAQGKVPPLETRVASLYPEEKAALPSKYAATITIRDLLTMSMGLDWDEPSPVHRSSRDDQYALIWAESRYHNIMDRPSLTPPGASFRYSGGATTLLGDIIERSTRMDLDRVVANELFAPLGITNWSWTEDLRGRPIGYAGLRLTPRDLAKIGVMVEQEGMWQGQQIVSANWVRTLSSPHIKASADYGYGYQWWTSTLDWRGQKLAVTEAIGNGGQRLYIVPALDLVIAATAGDYGDKRILDRETALFKQIAASVEPMAVQETRR